MSEELNLEVTPTNIRFRTLELLYPNKSFSLTRIAQELDVDYQKMYTSNMILIKAGLVVSLSEILDKGRIGRAGKPRKFLRLTRLGVDAFESGQVQ